ncbi:MAG TPA: response regulator [Pyrinomonadaceae bacterium]
MSSGRRKLLLADDSPTIQKVISLTFGDEDFEVVAVGDGGQALRALADEPPPDVVLADVVMPGPDGYELCERIKRDARLCRVPVILLVGTFEPFNEAEARRVGADIVLTKPFQSIRNLVGKVGSLLGGESKADEPAEAPAPRDERRAEEAHTRLDADAHPRHGAAFEEADEPRAEETAASFADLAADDELIEARPAEAFSAPPPFARRRDDAPAEPPDPDFDAAPVFETNVVETNVVETNIVEMNDGTPHDHAAAPVVPESAVVSEVEEDDFVLDVEEAEDTQPVFAAAQPRESVMTEPNFSQTSFEARATSAAAADDALLDLGQRAAPTATATAEADDFILDLGFDDEEPVAQASADVLDSPFEVEPAPAPSMTDAPSAFAEAAHGEPAHTFEPSTSFEPSYTFDASDTLARPEASAQHDEAPWRDVVVQDGPQGFAFGGEETQVSSTAPRGFVEPEVVPADEPVPAVVESEFTDGSVEGDLPKPQEPSTAGYAVGQARAGLEEPPRADQLSPEVIETIARRVVEMMSDKVVREIAWEVVPELAELLIKQKLEEDRRK